MIPLSISKRVSNPMEVNAAKNRIAKATAEGKTPATADKQIAQNPEYKYYGVSQVVETLSLEAFAGHIASHGSKYHKGDINVILTEAVTCLREQLLLGNKVTLGDLGSFSVSLKTEGTEKASDFSENKIQAVHVNWTPGSTFTDLRSDATFSIGIKRKLQAVLRRVENNTLTDKDDDLLDELQAAITAAKAARANSASSSSSGNSGTPGNTPSTDTDDNDGIDMS